MMPLSRGSEEIQLQGYLENGGLPDLIFEFMNDVK